MRSAADSHSLRLERSMQGLAKLGDWVDEVAARLRLPSEQEFALRLCLEEAVANVVMHGRLPADAARDDVALCVRHAASELHVTIEDGCTAFDPLQQPPPDTQADLEARAVGGMGIHLIRHYTRSMAYRRVAGMNRLELVIAANAAAG